MTDHFSIMILLNNNNSPSMDFPDLVPEYLIGLSFSSTCEFCDCSTEFLLAVVQNKRKSLNMPEFESVTRIYNLPIVESGLTYADNIYKRIKVSFLILPIVD